MQAAKRRRVELDPRRDFRASGTLAYNQQDHAAWYSGDPADALGAGSMVVSTPNGPAATLASTSTPNQQQWDAYDAATFEQEPQPYFSGYGQQSTDPSTYNSPWPPPQTRTPGFADHGSTYGASISGTMAYYGTNDTAVADASSYGDAAATSFQDYGQDIDMAGDYSYPSHSNMDAQTESLGPEESTATVFDDASMQLKNQSLPILDNLAAQLIQTTAKLTVPQMQEILKDSDTEEGQAYNTLRSLFEQTRKVYSRDTPFIDAIAIQMFQPSQQETIRKANIATFIASVLGAHDVSFFHLNEFFMETFVPLGHRLLKWQGAIFLDLKTQAYISALINSDGDPSAMLDELFPPDLDAQILTRHPDAPSLSPSEQDFLDRCRARKSYLLAEGNTDSALRELPKKYQWIEFVREFAGCISKNVESIMNAPARTERRNTLSNDNSQPPALLNASSSSLSNTRKDDDSTPKKPALASNASAARQPWTKPEEDALLSGLEQVKGPHWSQILALYGRGGSVSEVLKDRNQVQLKDKARNLKLWHLKMGREVPVALRGVTGELKKRGGKNARAALGIEDEEDAEGMEEEESAPDGGRPKGKGSVKRKTKKGS